MLPIPANPQASIPLLVTNHHVVKSAKRGLIELAESEEGRPVAGKRLRVEIDAKFLLGNMNPQDDLAVIPIGPIFNQLQTSGKTVFFRSLNFDLVPRPEVLEGLSAIEEVTFIGYPSGLYDEHNVTPLVRRGITATPVWNDFQGEPTFLIDAGVFPGSSGSPVFLFDQGGYTESGTLFLGANRLLFLVTV